MSAVLDGIRVCDFSWFGAGPISARILADFGADVIRVESQVRMDGLRNAQPVKPGREDSNDASGYFNNFNSNKRSLLLNMNADGAAEVMERLVRASDIFLTNFTPGVIDRWRLTYDRLRELNPGIIALYQSMQGSSGPQRNFLGFGAVLTPVTGLSALSGFAARPPFGLGTNYPDYVVNPGHTVIAILAALRHRRRTGEGQRLELSQLESVVATLGPALVQTAVNGMPPSRTGNRSSWMAPHGAFRCHDEDRSHPPGPDQGPQRERWLVIAVRDGTEWDALCREAQGQPFTQDERFATADGRRQHEDALEAGLQSWTRDQDAAALMERLQAAGCPAGVIQDAEDVLERDPHSRVRAYYHYLDHPVTGPAVYDGPVARLSATPGGPERPAPLLGEHTFEVATKVLGYSDAETAALIAAGVLT